MTDFSLPTNQLIQQTASYHSFYEKTYSELSDINIISL